MVPHRDTSEPGGPLKGKPEPPAPGDPLRGTPDSGGLSGAPHQVMSFSGGRKNLFVLLAATAEPPSSLLKDLAERLGPLRGTVS